MEKLNRFLGKFGFALIGVAAVGFSLSVSFGWSFTVDLTPLLLEYWPLALMLLAGYGVYRYTTRDVQDEG